MVKGVRDDVLIHVVAQVAIEASADVLVDGLQLDEHQRQAVDEADDIGAAVVVRRAQARELQLAHGEETVVARSVLEVDYASAGVAEMTWASRYSTGNAVSDQAGES